MALTDAGICNIALLRVGQRQTLDSLDDNTTEGAVCKAFYADARDAVLQSFPWDFATKRATLALVAGASRDGWEYVYALPADCLTPQHIWAGKRTPTHAERIRYSVEYDATTGQPVLLTDQGTAVLVYTARVAAVTIYPPLFVDALAWRLAADIALGLTLKPQLAQGAGAAYQRALAAAFAADHRQTQEDATPESDTITVR
jgi:hypothetical protein